VRIDGRLKRGVDPRVDALLERLDALPPKKRFPTVVQWLLMGRVMEDITTGGDVEAAMRAAQEIASAFVAEE
jgi:hypothetical protein